MFYQNNFGYPSFEDFKNKLSYMDAEFLQRLQAEARRRGISEQDIQNGMSLIQQLKR